MASRKSSRNGWLTKLRSAVLRRIIEQSALLPFASGVLRWSRTSSGHKVAVDTRSLAPDQITELEVTLVDRIATSTGETPFFLFMPRYAPKANESR